MSLLSRTAPPALILALALLIAAPLAPARADESTPRSILWEDLIPKAEPLVNPITELAPETREAVGFVTSIKYDIELGFLSEGDPEVAEAAEVQKQLEADGLDMEGLNAALIELEAEIARRDMTMVKELDGTVIRMPGYALPLEFSETGVMEFLLVPYVGACIHTPPPPANQTVFVELAEPYQSSNLYDPVWITGQIQVQPSSRSLSFVDGASEVATGYTIKALAIEPYN